MPLSFRSSGWNGSAGGTTARRCSVLGSETGVDAARKKGLAAAENACKEYGLGI